MISGLIKGREALVYVTVRGIDEREEKIEAVIDTGYTASLSLPPELITTLELPWQGTGRGTLADGSKCLFDVFEAEVLWDGQWRRLLIDEANSDPLLGMTLLRGYELRIEVRPQGKVEISPLDSKE